MESMSPAGPFAQLFKSLVTPGLAVSCLGIVVAVAAAAWGLLHWLPMPPVAAELQPAVTGLVVLAAFFFVMALLSLWALIRPPAPMAGAGGSVAVPRRGRVVADGEPLSAPLSGTPCVAYFYRGYRREVQHGELTTIWSYCGLGSMAFSLDAGDGRKVAVRAVPQLMDEPVAATGPQALARARRHVAATRFDAAAGVLGGVNVAAQTLAALTGQPVQPGQPFRRDWFNSQAGDVDLQRLQFEEVLLPLDAPATVVGHWLAAQQAIVPSALAHEPTQAACTPQGVEALRASRGDVSVDGDELSPPSAARSVVAVILLTLFGSGALALARML